jgi:hypothetical protein
MDYYLKCPAAWRFGESAKTSYLCKKIVGFRDLKNAYNSDGWTLTAYLIYY